MNETQPLVGIIMGSKSDLPVMSGAVEALKEMQIPYEITVVSAHRTPVRMMDYARTARGRGLLTIIRRLAVGDDAWRPWTEPGLASPGGLPARSAPPREVRPRPERFHPFRDAPAGLRRIPQRLSSLLGLPKRVEPLAGVDLSRFVSIGFRVSVAG